MSRASTYSELLQLILSDVGATIQVLLLIGKEFDSTAQRLSRMGHCLASLDVGTWFGAISAAPAFPADRQHADLTAMWKHSRLVAQYAQLVAESLDGVSPEDAYLVGLLHEIETIPIALGWPHSDPTPWCAMEGSLPLFVLAAMRVVNDACPLSTWRCILTDAHELAGAQRERGPSLPHPAQRAAQSGDPRLAVGSHLLSLSSH